LADGHVGILTRLDASAAANQVVYEIVDAISRYDNFHAHHGLEQHWLRLLCRVVEG
jgi:hypothetical protein